VTEGDARPKGGVSRRRMLERIGAGAAVAWTLPIVTTIGTPALALPSPSGCEGQVCQPPCDVLRPCHQPSNCACFPATDDPNHFCACGDIRDGLCASFTPCDSNADCGTDETCVESCCPTGICLPRCPVDSRKRRQSYAGPRVAR
jgi:hypothetical protein